MMNIALETYEREGLDGLNKLREDSSHLDMREIFIESCLNGHLEVAKWIYSIGLISGNDKFNIHNNHECIFRQSCARGYIMLAKWI